jgi:hypothetical protein
MKLHRTLIALAALSLGTAQAAQLTPADAAAAPAIYVSGSSALRFSLAAGFLEACDLTTVAVFGNTNGASAPGNNVRAYACTLSKDIKPSAAGTATAFTAGTKVVFTKYDAGGSINGIQPLVKGTALSYLNFSGTSCTSTGLVRSGTFNLTQIDYACAQGNNVVPQIGVSDVEASLIQNKNNLLSGATAVSTSTLAGGKHSVAMAGVAVNLALYRALQAAQGLTQDDSVANAPSLPAAFVASVESGNALPGSGNGFNALIADDGSATGSNSQSVQFCSRQNGSGTKAMHNAFLLGNPCSSTNLASVGGNSSSATAVDNGDFVYQLSSSTGNVIACLQGAETAGSTTTSAGYLKNWAIGMVGSENDPAAGTTKDANWRFVKVGGAYPNQANGQVGAYPMTYENYLYYPTSLSGSALNFAKWLQSDAVTPIALSHVPDVGTKNGILSIADITNSAYASVTNYIARTTRDGFSCKPAYVNQ